MELKLIEQSLGASEKCHHSLVEECWGKGPLIPLHFGKVGSNDKKKPPGRKSYVLVEVGLVWHCSSKDKGTRKGLWQQLLYHEMLSGIKLYSEN